MNDEIWKDIEGYEGLYQVSNLGRIKSFIKWNGHKYIKEVRIINPYKNYSDKYYFRSVIKLYKNGEKKDFKVHRLVAQAFIPNPNDYPIINHIDGNPLNNKVDNLEWCTQKYNVNHALENELKINKINTIDRDTMLELLNKGYDYKTISKILGIATGTVFNYIKKFKIKKIYI